MSPMWCVMLLCTFAGIVSVTTETRRAPLMKRTALMRRQAKRAQGERAVSSCCPSKRTLVLLKTTASQKGYDHVKNYWANLASAMYSANASNVEFVASVDVTPENPTFNSKHNWDSIPAMGNFFYAPGYDDVVGTHESLRALIGKFKSLAPQAKVHVCSDKDLLAEYPALAEAANRSKQHYTHPLGWGYNYASSLLVWELLKEDGFDYVWEFQDDVRFGVSNSTAVHLDNLITLIMTNEGSSSSLLVPGRVHSVREHFAWPEWGKPGLSEGATTPWMWADVGSDAYLQHTAVSGNISTSQSARLGTQAHPISGLPSTLVSSSSTMGCFRKWSDVYATRSSRALLDEMHRWCANERMCAWNEQFPQTIASCGTLGVAPITSLQLLQEEGGLHQARGGGSGIGYSSGEVNDTFRALNEYGAKTSSMWLSWQPEANVLSTT